LGKAIIKPKKELKKRKPKADSDNSWTVYAFWGADVTFGGSKREFFEPAPSPAAAQKTKPEKGKQDGVRGREKGKSKALVPA